MATTRRNFLQSSSAATLAAQAAAQQTRLSASDSIRIALIGSGGMGMGDTRMAVTIPGVELAACCDVYDGRLTRAKEIWGSHILTTRDHREVLARKDIDAVIVATPDHWHSAITIEALAAGKHVYCEKPMVHSIAEGKPVIEAQKKSGRILQIGSQYASSLSFLKARDLFRGGAIGELNMIESWLDRNSALGAWQYSIPPDASPQNVDWDRFLGKAPKRPFEPVRLFRWRNYNDYGTGLAGDLFVHLFTGIHTVTGALGPTRVFATGGLRFWKDGRDAPDVMLAVADYPRTESHPEFTLSLKVNFVSGGSGESFGVRFVGSEGVMTATMTGVTLSRSPRETEPGYTISTFAQAVQEQFLKEYHARYPRTNASADALRPETTERYQPPSSHNPHREHHVNFYNAVRSGKPHFEDAVFGLRTAGPALLCNVSYFERRPVHWDPLTLSVV
ncbi:MAG: Gfo/Idh/MocA family oxidoreductase [Acidobacteria bacterium]|nr:Gfo/Idh/MocA family oxidoreductase [Acidobacteriota bacterium]